MTPLSNQSISPKVKGAGLGGGLAALVTLVLGLCNVTLTPVEASALTTIAASVAGYLVPAP